MAPWQFPGIQDFLHGSDINHGDSPTLYGQVQLLEQDGYIKKENWEIRYKKPKFPTAFQEVMRSNLG